jgi:hypothetical protein
MIICADNASSTFQSVQAELKTAIDTLYLLARSGDAAFPADSLQSCSTVCFKATKETVIALTQLEQRKLPHVQIPISAKWNHPWFTQVKKEQLRNVKVGIGIFNRNATYEGTQGPGTVMHGRGKWGHKDGDSYVGGWKHDKRHGYGEYRWSNGDLYFGDWENNMRHGCGEFTQKSGETYSGQWQNNQKCGIGINKWPDGKIYRGSWKFDNADGIGVLILASGKTSGKRVEGNFQGAFPHKYAVSTWPRGQYYLGQYISGRRHGFGVEVGEDGTWYDSEWQGDMRHGFGEIVELSGEKHQGQWEKGKKCS